MMNYKYLILVITTIILNGCSSMTYSTKQEVSEKNSPEITEIKCVLMDACNAKASELCPNGYKVISNSESVPYVLNKMSVSCKTQDPLIEEGKK